MTDASAKVYLPLPVPDCPESVTRPAPLTGVHEEKRLLVLEHFSKEGYKLPLPETTDEEQKEDVALLMDQEKMFVTDECIQRYLRATKWDADAAIKRLETTLIWRRQYGLYDKITPEYVEPESLTGKEIIFGCDASRRPGLYMFPSRQNTEESPRQLEFATFMLERTLDLAGPGVETLALFINFADRAKNPSLHTSRTMLNILQEHYPERLGRAFIINIPTLVNWFFKVIMPFVDPITREKVKFNPNVVKEGHVNSDQLMNASGWPGDHHFEWDHAKYWPALMALCKSRQEEQTARWKELGGKVGLSEWDIKGGHSEPISTHAPTAIEEKLATEPSLVIEEVPVAATA